MIMSIKAKVLSAAIATALAAGIIASGVGAAFASGDDASPANEQGSAMEKELIKVSRDAFLSMRNLHNARLALFNGQPGQATTYVDAAVTRIGAAAKEAEEYAVEIKAPKGNDLYVPFEGNYTVLDSFRPVESAKAEGDQQGDRVAEGDASAEPIAKAKDEGGAKQVAKADEPSQQQAEAGEQLKLAEVDVAISTGLIPVNFAKAHIERASELVGEGKYYEANLELKAVEDAMLVQTVTLDETPKGADQTAKRANDGKGEGDSAASS
jgi:hypothetical protein